MRLSETPRLHREDRKPVVIGGGTPFLPPVSEDTRWT
jgi:hypothetical protein